MPSKSGARAPGPLLLHTDYARSAVEFGSLFWAWPVLARAPRGDGHPVLVVPGLVTGDATTFVLRTFLGRLGYRTYGWVWGATSARRQRPSMACVPGSTASVPGMPSR
jgi:hypothetical protein